MSRLLGDVEAYAVLFAHLQRVQLLHGFLFSPSAVAAVSHMHALVSIELHWWAGFGAEEEDVSAVLDAVAATCTELRECSCSGKYMADHRFASALAAVLIRNARVSSVRLTGYGLYGCHQYAAGTGERAGTVPQPAVLYHRMLQRYRQSDAGDHCTCERSRALCCREGHRSNRCLPLSSDGAL
jgi:hypothetical protein